MITVKENRNVRYILSAGCLEVGYDEAGGV
jgi:hypothetical protein